MNIFFKVFYDYFYHGQGGGWMTIVVTGALVGTCFLIHRYYGTVTARLKTLDESLGSIELSDAPTSAQPDPEQHTAVILVGGYSGLGVHTLLNAIRFMPHYFKNFIFISVGVVDSGNFKGAEELGRPQKTRRIVARKICRSGTPPRISITGYMAVGTDVVDELERLCRVVHRDFPKSVVFAGQLVFQRRHGTERCFTTRPPTRCSGGYSGTGFRWSFCPRGCGRTELCFCAIKAN